MRIEERLAELARAAGPEGRDIPWRFRPAPAGRGHFGSPVQGYLARGGSPAGLQAIARAMIGPQIARAEAVGGYLNVWVTPRLIGETLPRPAQGDCPPAANPFMDLRREHVRRVCAPWAGPVAGLSGGALDEAAALAAAGGSAEALCRRALALVDGLREAADPAAAALLTCVLTLLEEAIPCG